jgi:murein DD-endopeptidase MepM/ murein hydrolase activator NlpD
MKPLTDPNHILHSILMLTILLSPILYIVHPLFSLAEGVGIPPPEIQNVSINRDKIYRGFQTLSIVANITDRAYDPSKLRVSVEVEFSNGLTLKKAMVYLPDAKIFDIRIPIPESAGLGSAEVRVVAVNPALYNATYSTKIYVLDHRPVIELREEARRAISQLDSLASIASLVGINTSDIARSIGEIKRIFSDAEIALTVLEDVDRSIELYRQVISLATSNLSVVNSSIRAYTSIQSSISDISNSYKVYEALLDLLRLQMRGANLSTPQAILEAVRVQINTASMRLSEGRYAEAILFIRNASTLLDTLAQSIQSAIQDYNRRLYEASMLGIRHSNATTYYYTALARVQALKALGISSQSVEQLLDRAYASLLAASRGLSEGALQEASSWIASAEGNTSLAISLMDSMARDQANTLYNLSREQLDILSKRMFKPDTSYIENLLRISRESMNRGDYIAAVAYLNTAYQEALRLQKISSDTEAAFIVGIVVIAAGIISAAILLITGRRRGT